MDAHHDLFQYEDEEIIQELQEEVQENVLEVSFTFLTPEERLQLKNTKRTLDEVPAPTGIYWDCILNSITGQYEWHRITIYPPEIDMSTYAKPAFAFSAH